MSIMEQLQAVKKTLPQHVELVAVSKTKPISAIEAAYDAGQRLFGENRVQELLEKHEVLPKDIKWHLIGHLQTNKVKNIARFVDLIHSVDSLKLLSTINKEAVKNNRVIDCLLQVRIASEETKFGIPETELEAFLKSPEFSSFNNINVKGLMGMSTNTDNKNVISEEFGKLSAVFSRLKSTFFRDKEGFKTLSMGMSGDYELAISEGSNMVRIGSTIFGKRD